MQSAPPIQPRGLGASRGNPGFEFAVPGNCLVGFGVFLCRRGQIRECAGSSSLSTLGRCLIDIAPPFQRVEGGSLARAFFFFQVHPTVECQDAAKQAVDQWDVQALVLCQAHRVDGVVVGAGVDRFQNGWFFGGYAQHPGLQVGDLFCIGIVAGLSIGQQIKVGFLQRLMVSGLAAKVKDELQRTDHRNSGANHFDRQRRTGGRVANGGGTKQQHHKIATPVSSFVRATSCGVINRIPQDVEPNALQGFDHANLYFLGGGAAGVVDGWRGPTLDQGKGVPAGCRGPAERIVGCLGPALFPKCCAPGVAFSDMKFLSLFLGNLGEIGGVGGVKHQRRRLFTIYRCAPNEKHNLLLCFGRAANGWPSILRAALPFLELRSVPKSEVSLGGVGGAGFGSFRRRRIDAIRARSAGA